MEHKIGEIVTLPDGRKAEVVDDGELTPGRCSKRCQMYKLYLCWSIKCKGHERSDHKNIIYKEIKEE